VIDLETAVWYVGAAYAVVWLLTVLYIGLLRQKLGRLERQLAEAEEQLAARAPEHHGTSGTVH
jgi:CcmD family protein